MHYASSHYIIPLQLSRGFSSKEKKKKKKRKEEVAAWNEESSPLYPGKWRRERDAERSFLESNCLPLNPASRLCSRVFVLTELIPPPVGRKLPIEADPHHLSLSLFSLLRAITPRFNQGSKMEQSTTIYNESLSYFEGPPYSSSRTAHRTRRSSSDPCLHSKRPLIAEFFLFFFFFF